MSNPNRFFHLDSEGRESLKTFKTSCEILFVNKIIMKKSPNLFPTCCKNVGKSQSRHRCGLACKALQKQQSDAIPQVAANISAPESSRNALCACWMLQIPPVCSACYTDLCFHVLKLSHILKNIPALFLGLIVCIVNSLEMPQFLLHEGAV